MERFTGGCLCGDVRIEASGLPFRVGLCHCMDCRKHHGALFHGSAIFPESAVTVEGETRCSSPSLDDGIPAINAPESGVGKRDHRPSLLRDLVRTIR